MSIGTGANYPAMELIGPLLPEVVNIEHLPDSYILGNDTHICMSYEYESSPRFYFIPHVENFFWSLPVFL